MIRQKEIGYYVSGQEPYVKLYEYKYEVNGQEETIHFSSLQDGLQKIPDKQQRKEFAMNVKLNENGQIDENASTGIKDIRSICGTSVEDSPLSVSGYEEKYFLDSEDNENEWTPVKFIDVTTGETRTDTVSIAGDYQENPAGTGNYTKGDQMYYPIRKGNTDDENRTEKYRENIQNFYYSDGEGAQAPYFLEFEPVQNSFVNDAIDNKEQNEKIGTEYDYSKGKYGYYENVYADLTEEIVADIQDNKYTFPGENPSKSSTFDQDSLLIQQNVSTQSDAFSEGEEGEFSSVNTDAAASDGTASDFESSQNDGFSDGDFSSGGDEIGDTPAVPSVQTEEQGNTSDNLTAGTTAPESENTDTNQTVILGEIVAAETQAQNYQADPNIYIGENIDEYPYYKYTLVGDLEYIKNKVKECQDIDKAAESAGNPIQRQTGDITVEDGQYWYWQEKTDQSDYEKITLSIVTGKQPVAYSDVKKIDSRVTENYYYRVKNVYFCCISKENGDKAEDFQYFGWYYPSYPENEDPYIKVNPGEAATYYISDAEYKLTPGKGNYDFIPGGDQEQDVEVDHMYYKGGYTNYDWFKRYVFHLSPEDADFDKFNIEVKTMTSKAFNTEYGDGTNNSSAKDTDVASIVNEGTDDVDSATDTSENQVEDTVKDERESTDNNSESEQSENEGETSEVNPIVSEAGVELVSIENEISDGEETSDFQDGTETLSADENETETTFSAGDTSEDTEKLDLSDYDLVYINGNELSAESFKSLASLAVDKKVPCIINQDKLAGNTDFSDAFSGFINNEDTDGHYVNTCVYFFKNTLQAQGQNNDLINTLFNTNFNPEAGEDQDQFTDDSQVQGFEEILKYIEKENKYREIRNNSITDGDDSETDTDLNDGTDKYKLDTKLSQARAIEYIINYKYKRNDIPTGEVRVLELQPAKSYGEITESKVLNWLGYDNQITVSSCCNHNGEAANNVLNKNKSIWHSSYDNNGKVYDESTHPTHWIKMEFEKETDVNGFIYTARPTGKNGVLNNYEIKFYDKDGNPMNETQEGTMGYDWYNIDRSPVKKLFKNSVKNVKSMVLIFKDTFGDSEANKYATASYIMPIINNTYIDITTMTTSEFVGHIEDVNTKYDMIYLGDDSSTLKYDGNFRPDADILYYHIGGTKIAMYELQGLMNHDYITKSNGVKAANTIDTTDANTGTTVGSIRGSGNDITSQIKDKLVDFAKSGYPVVVAGNIYDSNKSVSTKLVDNSSYIYDFLNDIKGYDNVYREKDIEGDEDISFYTELPKPKIKFASENGTPESAVGTSEGPSGKYMSGDNITFNFQIIDEAEASPANASYNCELYIDLNCDGNYAESEKLKDIIVSQDGTALKADADGKYHLSLKTSYTVSRKIPEEYIKLMPWKLVITNNANEEIRTSEIGYTKRQNTNIGNNKIRVLQIMPNPNNRERGKCTWNLATDTKFDELFNAVKQDFEVQIDGVTVSEYEANLGKNKNYLDTYNMVIVGFCDGAGYGSDSNGKSKDNFSEEGVKGILNFANTGKSVILAHDNTSSSNYDRNAENKIEGKNTLTWKGWAYYFNKMLRSVSGMDRYGITAAKTSDILKRAENLQEGTDNWNTVLKNSYDMAYELNSAKTKTYSETQGFTNGKLRIAMQKRTETNTPTIDYVSNVNEGAISEYPYKIDSTFKVATTHMQYYQLAMEEDSDHDGSNDIVVWYCLGNKGGSESYYDLTPNDVRNNYYIYSYKNIIYTGVGHDDGITDMEKKLFVNTIIAAYNAQAVNPDLSFVKQSNWNAEQEKSVYYMLDNVNFNESQELVKDSQDFHLKVTDSNLVGTSINGDTTKDLKLELYIESDSADAEDVDGIEKKVIPVNVPVYLSGETDPLTRDSNGNLYVYSGNVYDFTLSGLQQLLSDNLGQYKGRVTLYAKISCKYMYYGVEKEAQSITQVDICQRQLFDMD